MPTPLDCLEFLQEAKSSAADPESAYVLRSRLKRSVVAAAQLAATRAGVEGPIMPNDVSKLQIEEPQLAQVIQLAVSLLAATRKLCQPSEALDSRWRAGWSDLQGDLERLECALRGLEQS